MDSRHRLQAFCSWTLALLCALSLCAVAGAQANPTLSIDLRQAKAKVSPALYGLMTEEINYSYDGGLYGELVRNRTFQDGQRNSTAHWFPYELGDAEASMKVDPATGPSAALPLSVAVTIANATAKNQAGIANEGYWGIPLRPKTVYRGSFYAKASDPAIGPVSIALINDDTGKGPQTTVPALTTQWKRYEFTLVSGDLPVSRDNRLVLSVGKPGTIWFSLVSLFPPTYHGRPNGNRIDLMEKLAAMHPRFLRFPGGNYLEGNTIDQRFDWKKTIGPLVDRPTHMSPWGYRSSDGMGLLEFLSWCEDLGMQPVLAVYAGYSLRQEHVNPGPDLEPYVADALDELEYVTGGASTKWGAERAKDGHPAPFKLTYVEIGNEDQFDRSGSYDGRYAQFYRAIKARYPDLQIIATAPVKSVRPDVIDEHFYRSAAQFFADTGHYDNASRQGPKIFVGEWATREGGPTPDFGAALGDAAWMTGLERNSDIVVMASYAPLFVNVNPGGMQWESDLIGYDALSSYGSPSYYAQVMFSNHLGDEILNANLEGEATRFFYSVTRDSGNGRLYVKLVNATSDPRPLTIRLDGALSVGKTGKLIEMSAKTTAATNTILEPENIVPVESKLTNVSARFSHTVPPYCIQVLELDTR